MEGLSWANVSKWCQENPHTLDVREWTDWELLAAIAKGNGTSIPCDPISERWNLVSDMTRDGMFTISDVWQWLGYLFHAPADAGYYLIMRRAPDLAQFLEISVASYGNWPSGVLSTLVWVITYGLVRWGAEPY
jgi:hypothetical protein